VPGVVTLGVIAVAIWYLLVSNRPVAVTPMPIDAARLSIVVLPFTSLSNDPSQDYFADGVTENPTTDLSRIDNCFVIARAIGRELGVRYVLEGSVQRDQDRLRVDAQLIDAGSGARIFGPTASGRMSPTCSSFRIMWWRHWPIAWAMNSAGPRRKRAPVPKARTPWISPWHQGVASSPTFSARLLPDGPLLSRNLVELPFGETPPTIRSG
jgi:TolB-like protein